MNEYLYFLISVSFMIVDLGIAYALVKSILRDVRGTFNISPTSVFAFIFLVVAMSITSVFVKGF